MLERTRTSQGLSVGENQDVTGAECWSEPGHHRSLVLERTRVPQGPIVRDKPLVELLDAVGDWFQQEMRACAMASTEPAARPDSLISSLHIYMYILVASWLQFPWLVG